MRVREPLSARRRADQHRRRYRHCRRRDRDHRPGKRLLLLAPRQSKRRPNLLACVGPPEHAVGRVAVVGGRRGLRWQGRERSTRSGGRWGVHRRAAVVAGWDPVLRLRPDGMVEFVSLGRRRIYDQCMPNGGGVRGAAVAVWGSALRICVSRRTRLLVHAGRYVAHRTARRQFRSNGAVRSPVHRPGARSAQGRQRLGGVHLRVSHAGQVGRKARSEDGGAHGRCGVVVAGRACELLLGAGGGSSSPRRTARPPMLSTILRPTPTTRLRPKNDHP